MSAVIKNKAALPGSDRHNAAVSTVSHLFEVSGRLHLPYGLHESVSDNNTDVRSRVALRAFAQGHKVGLC